MNTTILKIWYGQVAAGIGAPIGYAPMGMCGPLARAPGLLRTAIGRLFIGRTTWGDDRNY